jgi:hypothetical protein
MRDEEALFRQLRIKPFQQLTDDRRGWRRSHQFHRRAAIQPGQRGLCPRVTLVVDLEDLPARTEPTAENLVEPGRNPLPGVRTKEPR